MRKDIEMSMGRPCRCVAIQTSKIATIPQDECSSCPRGPIRRLVLLAFLGALMVYEEERHKNDGCSNPVDDARVLVILYHLANQRERNRQRQAHRHDERRREQHSIRPRHVADER